MSEILKPCPFCGGEARTASDATGFLHWVYCPECGGQSGYFTGNADGIKKLAIDAWNTRVQIPGEVCEIEGTGEGVQLPVVEERTCENVGYYIDPTRFKCSACDYNGWVKYANGGDKVPRYCPNCGAKVVDDD